MPKACDARRFYRPELDIFRFGAFLMVFLHHTLPGREDDSWFHHLERTVQFGSAFGVPIFFFLSAYLITELLFRERDKTGTMHMRSFYVRRVLRIWPLYFGFLAFTVILGEILHNGKVPAIGLLAFLFLRGNWWFGLGNTVWLATPLWSISVEEQFYLVLPWVIRKLKRATVVWVAVAVWLVSQVFTWYLAGPRDANSTYLRTDSMVMFQYFALGILICVLLKDRIPRFSPITRVLLIMGGLFIIYGAEWHFMLIANAHTKSPAGAVTGYLSVGIGIVPLFLGSLGARIPPSRLWLTYLGRISYGLYVYHFAVLKAIDALTERSAILRHGNWIFDYLIGLPLTILIAHLSYKYFESPFLRLKERFTFVESRPVSAITLSGNALDLLPAKK
jgi:peptidoglycan/LPS O-acetylase OafA/YrhL